MDKILLIDDDENMLDVMESTLTYYGYEVASCNFTDDIFSLVKLHQPDLVVLDFLMPGINGGEMCAALKRNEQTKRLPVIIVSAYERILQSLGNYGSDAFISKPFDMKHLLFVIQKVIGNVAMTQAASPSIQPRLSNHTR